MITLRFVSHPGPFNVACRLAQYGFWCSHVEAVMEDGHRLGARFFGGVQARAKDYDAGGFIQELFLVLRASEDQVVSFFHFLKAQIGKPYDSLAILTFLGNRDWQAPDSWFCSELIAAGLAACGLFPQHLAVRFDRITPRDMFILASALVEANGGADG